MKILFVCLSGAGDILMATPLIREIRMAYPEAKIDVLVMQGKISKDILINNKDIDKIIYFNFMGEGYIKSLIFCKKLKKENYDLSITTYPQARYQYSVTSWLINAKRRIGFNYETQKLKLNRLFFTETIDEDFSEHVVENNLAVVEKLRRIRKIKEPRMIFNLSVKEKKFAENYFKNNKMKKAILVHAGSGKTKNFILKRWNKKKFVEVCRIINYKKKMPIILLGGDDEKELKDWIINKSGIKEKEIFNLNADINQVAAVINKGELIISNDTIMAHIAAALNKKVIVLFGPTSPQNTGPYTKNKCIICKNTQQFWKHGRKGITKKQAESMEKIHVKDVYGAVERILKKKK